MKAATILKTWGLDILKGVAAAVVTIPGLIAGGIVSKLLGLASPEIPAYINMTALMPLMLLSGVLIAIMLGQCFRRLRWGFWPRLVGIWLSYYLLYYLLNLLDGLLFTPMPHMSTGIISDLFPALFAAAVIAALCRPQAAPLPARAQIAGFFSSNQRAARIWPLAVAWLIFPPLYYLVGRVVALFTLHYYQDPSLNLGLTLPAVSTMLLMQVLRGALFLLAVLPIIISWNGSRRSLWLWVGTVIFVQIANQVVIQAYWLPVGLRAPHAVELLVDSFAQAAVYVWLLYAPQAGAGSRVEQGLSADGQTLCRLGYRPNPQSFFQGGSYRNDDGRR